MYIKLGAYFHIINKSNNAETYYDVISNTNANAHTHTHTHTHQTKGKPKSIKLNYKK